MDLIRTIDFGIDGTNYYWVNRERFKISLDELRAAGITDKHAYVRPEMEVLLLKANRLLARYGYQLVVVDAWRPKAMYELVHGKLVAKQGQARTDATLNVKRLAHATGLTVDVEIVDLYTGDSCNLRDKDDGGDASFIGFYADRGDDRSGDLQHRQIILIGIMVSCGFVLGTKKEVWHFEYLLDEPGKGSSA